ncbi:MAG: 16S rRNA (cytidine(1402)-2'-O)-methyltransferase [Candidatus Paceibacterota bacterium]|jgi:16S rRNA (cytidine1402-2'-O)-methyltransferase
MATLYIVATPIGNLEDITLRAIRILKEVDTIVCEDTRVTKKLLEKYLDNPKRVLSFHAHSDEGKVTELITLLTEGKSVALVTDAGTPGVSDPGSRLVSAVRKEFGDEVRTEPIPGPSAITTALSVAGIEASAFTFLGFLPHKKGRETLFNEIKNSERTMIFYESSHRILKTIERLAELLSETRKVVIARELTKKFEEIISGTPAEVLAKMKETPDRERGEFVVLVGPLV